MIACSNAISINLFLLIIYYILSVFIASDTPYPAFIAQKDNLYGYINNDGEPYVFVERENEVCVYDKDKNLLNRVDFIMEKVSSVDIDELDNLF